MLFHEFLKNLFPDTFLCMFAPLDTRNNVIVNNKTALLAGDLEIVREDFHLLTTLWAFFNCQGWCPLVGGTWSPVKHGAPSWLCILS